MIVKRKDGKLFDFINYSTDKIQIFLLVLLRATGFLAIAPIFSHSSVPKTIRVGFMIILSGLVASTLQDVQIEPIESVWQLAGLAVQELLVGIIISLTFLILFYGAQTAGSIVGYQIGLALATEFDPSLSSQVSIIGKFWYLLAMLVFLTINGHHLLISAFVDSYQAVPPAGVHMSGSIGEIIIRLTAYVFVIGLKIAAPIMIALFLTDVALGAIAKMMPTMNVFFIGFPVKIALGLTMMALSLPAFAYVLEQGAAFLDRKLDLIFLSLGKA